jgi:hypothetical protein
VSILHNHRVENGMPLYKQGVAVQDERGVGRSGAVSLTEADVIAALGPGYMPISIMDMPIADPAEPLFRMLLSDDMSFIGGAGNAGIAATAPSALRIRKNGAANGTITFTGTAAVVSFTDPDYAAGDIFELYPPVAVDATLDWISITLGVA